MREDDERRSNGRAAICASASSGQETISSSALGIRSFVASLARASTTIVRQPSASAAAQRCSAVSTAPKTTRRGLRPKTSQKIFRPFSSMRTLRPRRSSSSTEAGSSPMPSPSVSPLSNTSDFAPTPFARDDLVEHRRLLTLGGREQPLEQRALVLVHEDLDLATAGKPDRKPEVVGDPVVRELRRRAAEGLLGEAVDLVLDAAAGDRARQLAAFGDAELCADRARRGAAGRDHGGQRDRSSRPSQRRRSSAISSTFRIVPGA